VYSDYDMVRVKNGNKQVFRILIVRWKAMTDRRFHFVNEIYIALGKQANKHGIGSLTFPERVAHLSWWASGIIGNGGFRFFYEGATNVDQVAEAYETLGFQHAAAACRQSKSFFPLEIIAKGYEATREWMNRFSDEELQHFFSELDKKIWEIKDDLTDAVAKYINANLDQFIHLPKRMQIPFNKRKAT
jgi:hypothetical protein